MLKGERTHALRAALGGDQVSEPFALGTLKCRLRLVPQEKKDRHFADASSETTEGTPDLVTTRHMIRVIADALIDAETLERVASHEELADVLTTGRMRELLERYERLEALHSPTEPEDLLALMEQIRRLVGNGERDLSAYLRTCEYSTLTALSRCMASRLFGSPSQSSTPTSNT